MCTLRGAKTGDVYLYKTGGSEQVGLPKQGDVCLYKTGGFEQVWDAETGGSAL